MRSVLILAALLGGAIPAFAKEGSPASRRPSSDETKCVTSLEGTARTVSIATGMSRTEAIGTANLSEVNGKAVVVYIGAHASFDRYEFAVSNFATCTISGFSMSKAE